MRLKAFARLLWLPTALVTFISAPSLAESTAKSTAESTAEQAEFIDRMVSEHQFEREEVERLLGNAEVNEDILAAIQRPWEAKPWHQYYPIFLTEKRLAAGVKFMREHADTLARAEETYGVPPEIVTAIIGVETFYGTYQGKYNVLDALVTLGFHYPPRQSFFRSELEEYLLLTRAEKLPIEELKGSYAGAMGLGQFISSSYRHYAVDFDNDGVRDILTNPIDAIGSVANYFKQHKWLPGEPVAVKLDDRQAHADLATDGLGLDQTVAELTAQGLHLPEELSATQRAKVFAFEQLEGEQEYWLGLNNFYTITRYNHSALYAMAVYQLSEQIRTAYEEQP